MVSKDMAKYFSREQRNAVCEWCRVQGKPKCKKCGFSEVPPFVPRGELPPKDDDK